MPSSIKLHISGEFACFTRPEMKVERVSYDVILQQMRPHVGPPKRVSPVLGGPERPGFMW